ncbi:MAG: protein phosphatase 2C domain-containing protein [Thermodesulfobacteriota bacterium]|nr:protein phosphatase 2C domain-containing protein [Thermodesulfobacteriota bacterium]
MKTDYILESGSGNSNEDTMVLEKNLFGVFDGATSLDNKIFSHGKTGGLIASSTAGSIFAKNCHPLVKLAKGANRAIYNQMLHHGVNLSKKENLWSTSAAVVRIKENKLEWVQTGDCFIILIYRDNSYKVLVEQDDHDYETLTMWKMAAEKISAKPDKTGPGKTMIGKTVISETLMDQIRKTRSGMNKNYGVLNGEKEADNFLNHGYEPLNRAREILLFTDGLSIPKKTPGKSKEFSTLVDDYLDLGLHGLKEKIRGLEKKDPHCTLYPRFKCHDDIAAISIKNF